MSLTRTKQLNVLFNNWIEEQKKERENFYNYFARDGIIDEEKYESSQTKLLFILKEPNILNDFDSSKDKYDDNQLEFYRDFFEEKYFEKNKNNEIIPTKKKEIEKRNKNAKRKNYYYFFDNKPVKQKEKIARIAEYVIDNKKITDNYEILENALKQVAVMNFNKSGGDSTSDKDYFLKYCKRFSNNICKEINIINPDLIILVGGRSYREQLEQENNNIKEILEHNNRKVIELVHTSARGRALNISKQEKITLEEIFKNQHKKYDINNLDNTYKEIVKTDISKLHLRYDRGVFKYLLKFIAKYGE